jgi:hypothetical protein
VFFTTYFGESGSSKNPTKSRSYSPMLSVS